MRWFRRRRRVDASDMEIVSASAGMLSIPTVVIEVHVQPPVIKVLGTIPVPTFPEGIIRVEEGKNQ